MRKIIDGKLYDTTTAEQICDISTAGYSRGDFKWDSSELYRSPNGVFFIAGEGNAASRWAEHIGQSERGPGKGLEVLKEFEAQALVEKFCSVERYVELFGEPEVG